MNSETPSLPQPEPGRLARPLTSDTSGWKRWLPGLADAAPVRPHLAPQRPGGRPRVDDDAGAGRHRLRRGIRRPRHLRPVRHHHPAPGIRAVRSQPHPGAGAGFFPGRADPRGRPAAVSGRSGAGGRAGRHDGGGVGSGVHRGGPAATGIHHRTALQADPLRLHERHCAHSADQPAAQAVRGLDRELPGRCATSGGSPPRCWAARPTGPRLPSARARSR